jgi:hypothetical protein
MSRKGEFGEGNYKASQRYRERTEAFIESGKVDEAARNAPAGSAEEQAELEQAEQDGKARTAEEDPGLHRR